MLTAPLFGFLLAATTASHAASFSGSFVAVYPAEYGSSGVLTIAGGGTSIHGSGVMGGGSLNKTSSGSLTLSGGSLSLSGGSLTLSGGTLAVNGNAVLSTSSSGGFNESIGTLTISPRPLLLFANSSATDWRTGSHLSWTGTPPDGTLRPEGSQLELSFISFIDPSSFTGSTFSAVQLQDLESGATGLTLVPEPSGGLLAIAGGAFLLTGRRRSRGTALPDGTRSA